jgi:hypothetical protein
MLIDDEWQEWRRDGGFRCLHSISQVRDDRRRAAKTIRASTPRDYDELARFAGVKFRGSAVAYLRIC